MDAFTIIALVLLALFALLLLWLEGLFRRKYALAISIVLVCCAFVLRYLFMEHETLDYQYFLSAWTQYFRDNGGFRALSGSIGNYNLPYLYFLALFSCLGVRDLFLIKLLSIFFDVVLAWGVMRLVGAVNGSDTRKLLAFFLTLLLPTVVLNGSCWGQCDSIYAAFAVLAVFCALNERPVLSLVFIAVSFSFKLQAVFIMPLWFVFLYTRRVKWFHLPVFPVTYAVLMLPAVIAGRPFLDTLTLYFDQAGSVGSGLNYNSPSIYAFISGDVDAELYSRLGIIAAFLLCAVIFLWLYLYRERVDRRTLLGAAVIFTVGLPLLLPHMHDRYFFMADVFSLALALTAPAYFVVPVCVSFASLLGYHAYLKTRYLLPMSYGASALIVVMILVLLFTAFTLRRKKSTRKR